ncbi:MAG TPA: hypothetical protein PK924_01225 [Bacilli bacterium]|jgi:hypothetical protein|nr:hypothetical protein [Acholeplasmataceae bacterium]MDY0338945.1 hypothetical protein [Acholeplasmataceae bacterium]HQD91865.1 hypothetical protein [Bacilli bacterium]
MAIIKVLNSSVGVDVSYHRVVAVNINYLEKTVNIGLASYVDVEKRSNKCRPLEVVDIAVPKEDFNLFLKANPIKVSYKWLKNNVDGFDEALDDLEERETEDEVDEPTEDEQ